MVLSNVEFRQTEDSGWGAFARGSSDGQVRSSIHLPVEAIITPNVAREALGDALGAVVGDLAPATLIKALVGHWRHAPAPSSATSPFQPYIDMLPAQEDIGSPLTLSTAELEVYRGTNLHAGAVQTKLDMLRREWAPLEAVVPLHDFVYGHLVVTSRAFPLRIVDPSAAEEAVMLLPLVDLLNHKPRAAVEWRGQNGFTIETEAPANSQLWNNYGPKGNEELLMGYGFVVEDNEFELLHLTLHLEGALLAKVESLGVEMKRFNDYTTHEQNAQGGVVFIVNRFHPLPRGLVECFALGPEGETALTLANTLNGIQHLRATLKAKFKGTLDVMPKRPEQMSLRAYETASTYRRGQLAMYNALMQSIKDLERTLVRTHKDKLSKIKANEESEQRGKTLYVREGKSPLAVSHLCIDNTSWYPARD